MKKNKVCKYCGGEVKNGFCVECLMPQKEIKGDIK